MIEMIGALILVGLLQNGDPFSICIAGCGL